MKIESSDEFYSILSSLLEKGAKPKDFCKEIKEQITKLLEADDPSKT
jgi:hypothetical protein